jgi:hypothetical protein
MKRSASSENKSNPRKQKRTKNNLDVSIPVTTPVNIKVRRICGNKNEKIDTSGPTPPIATTHPNSGPQ